MQEVEVGGSQSEADPDKKVQDNLKNKLDQKGLGM
jgi:hypothetical protein